MSKHIYYNSSKTVILFDNVSKYRTSRYKCKKNNIASEAMSVNYIPACYTTVVVHNLLAGFSCWS